MYLNVTNKCTNDCVYCIKNFDRSLRLEREPSPDEIWENIVRQKGDFTEIVYCGFGEPMFRLDDVILPLTPKIKEIFSGPIRINTNGQADVLYSKRDIPREIADSGVDIISISLVAEEVWLYNFLCKPKFIGDIDDGSVYQKVMTFIENCRQQERLEVEVTALDVPMLKMPQGIAAPDMRKCMEIADRLDGKPAQAIECGDVPIERLTDSQLNATRISCAAPIFGACRSNASRATCLRYSNRGNR